MQPKLHRRSVLLPFSHELQQSRINGNIYDYFSVPVTLVPQFFANSPILALEQTL